jgi:hypothetical protein
MSRNVHPIPSSCINELPPSSVDMNSDVLLPPLSVALANRTDDAVPIDCGNVRKKLLLLSVIIIWSAAPISAPTVIPAGDQHANPLVSPDTLRPPNVGISLVPMD